MGNGHPTAHSGQARGEPERAAGAGRAGSSCFAAPASTASFRGAERPVLILSATRWRG